MSEYLIPVETKHHLVTCWAGATSSPQAVWKLPGGDVEYLDITITLPEYDRGIGDTMWCVATAVTEA